ncbi:formate acetyltransferase activating enzyme [Agrilactobacillus composti DSM 18527 = JCM 14202]|uniref:Formate acetyltransferase activating enzyme n=1 Tax=Agrilactobacillus composti DSM 18527 = JCM 14202 TaxID=1423734 RepID=X0PEP6_9LACO|nr:glycyl-radical enzyme activating protein [Agrilactobacillus composti]KRM36248.1 formate acetyltransferase activating enzyme [Agrilactobacillus composti DSM 18527 = JCM 14202]GAF39988.1 pyruvate formate-lyase activating enzyme [Agrilactobacillus composti DSM 18527 = JCM 14202]
MPPITVDQTKPTPADTQLKGLIFNIQKFSLNDGPGIRTVVFFKGCPLRCAWCANPESQSGLPETMQAETRSQPKTVGTYQTVDEVMATILEDLPFYEESGGGVTLSGGEVLFQPKFAIALAKAIKAHGIHLACETTGFAQPAIFEEFMAYVDLMYYDCKQWDTAQHKVGTGLGNELVLANLKLAVAAKQNLCVRIPVIPGFNYSDTDAQHFAQLFNQLGINDVELLPFHQFGLKKYADLHRKYALADVKQLQTADLLSFQRILVQQGITAKINGW